MITTAGAVATCLSNFQFLPFEMFHAMMVYCKWISLLYYLQPVPLVGPVIRMVFAILWDIKDILLVDAVLITGLASGLYTLLNARGGGYDDPADALYTTRPPES